MAEAISSLHIGFYLASHLLVLLNSLILAMKFRILMKLSGINQKVMTLFRINQICRFYSFFSYFRYRTRDHQMVQCHEEPWQPWDIYHRNGSRKHHLSIRSMFFGTGASIHFDVARSRRHHPTNLSFSNHGDGSNADNFHLSFSPRLQGACNHLLARVKATFPFFQRNLFHFKANLLVIYFGHTIVLLKCLPIAIIRYLLYRLRVYLLSLAIDAPLDFYQIGCGWHHWCYFFKWCPSH